MEKILKIKGYNGNYSIYSIVSWLNQYGIRILFEYNTLVDGTITGYSAILYSPPYTSFYSSRIYSTKEEALFETLSKCIDYIPTKNII